MPKIFSDEQKKTIRRQIIDAAKVRFASVGVKAAKIAEITADCGIAKGTFYSFFGSKEELAFAIINDIEKQRRQLLTETAAQAGSCRKAVASLLKKGMEVVDTNPVLKKITELDEFPYIFRKIPQRKLDEHNRADEEFASSFIDTWKRDGKMKNIPTDIITASFKALVLSCIYKKDIGSDRPDAAIDLLVQALSVYLTDTEKTHD